MERIKNIDNLEQVRKSIIASRKPDLPSITVCGGTGCRASGSEALAKELTALLKKNKLRGRVEFKMSGCHGFCQRGPVVVINPMGIFYQMVGRKNPKKDAGDIIRETIGKGKIVNRLLYEDPISRKKIANYSEIPFYKKQHRIALRDNGKIDPEKIEDYIEVGGYRSLGKALSMSPESILDEVKRSGLRGRGGGGFPTGQKWGFARNAPNREMRYIICNADEGDPGAFMDRSIMEGNPHAVIEGMLIGAIAIARGVSPVEGYIYIRAEYPLAVKNIQTAIRQAEEAGLLGDNILGSYFSFHIKVKEGAGAFVCGEETALMASIEGRRGMPRTRPPFPAISGLWGKPTNINNVETWANIPQIIERGADWYASIGTEKSKGTKVFSLVGKVKNSGLVEVPMGIPLKEIIYDIGGGILEDKQYKAAQTGGPSGGCIPAEFLDLPVDYENLTKIGSIMGSGGLVVMDEDTCMVDLARYFLTFTQSESCGKCVPCRLGTKQMLNILEDICAGRGRPGDIELLEELAATVKAASLCGLGQTAPNPVLTTIKYFRHEYEEHIYEKFCRAAVCRGIVRAPCTHTCPAGVDVPKYIRFVSAGRFDDALLTVRERIPFASVCGRVCFHPCEARCRRRLLDEAVSVRMIKRAAVDYGLKKAAETGKGARPSGKKIAIVGSGPAGLTAAYYLKKVKGHDVTVFESLPKPGGMLRYGIPRYRLPAGAIDVEINRIRKTGVKIKTNHPVENIQNLLKQGFDAVFAAFGAWRSVPLGIGPETEGVLDCLSFLRNLSMGKKVKLGERVAVVGGGNSAIDSARSAIRAGAKEVILLYRRTRMEMVADPDEIRDAEEEGVQIQFLTLPTRVTRDKKTGRLNLKCIKMKLGEIDSSGRRKPIPIEGSEFSLKVDRIISAIGQVPEIPPSWNKPIERGNRIIVNPKDLSTGIAGIFAGGDVVRGPSSVIEAISDGRRAAQAIDIYLGGNGEISETLAPSEPVELLVSPPEDAKARYRPTARHIRMERRRKTFDAVELRYTKDQAIEEASRCLRCDLEE